MSFFSFLPVHGVKCHGVSSPPLANAAADLTDDVKLCGAFCVWLSREKRMWLSGRLLSATWDVDELLEKKDQIQEQDLLKFGYRVGGGNA